MTKKSHSQLALKAMRRASTQAIEKAASKGLKIPVWENGKVVLVNAKDRIKGPPSRKGLWTIDVNRNWRVVFEFKDGNAYVVDYEDYH